MLGTDLPRLRRSRSWNLLRTRLTQLVQPSDAGVGVLVESPLVATNPASGGIMKYAPSQALGALVVMVASLVNVTLSVASPPR